MVGSNRAVVVVSGANFFPGTAVALGDQTYRSSDDGLILKSEKTLQLSVPLTALMNDTVSERTLWCVHPSRATIVPLANSARPRSNCQTDGFRRLCGLRFVFSLADPAQTFDWPSFPKLPAPLLQVNDQILNTTLVFYSDTGRAAEVYRRRCLALLPAELLPSNNCSVVLKFPFVGPDWIFKNCLTCL